MVESNLDYLICKSNNDFKVAALAHPFISLLLSILKEQFEAQQFPEDFEERKK